MRNALVALVLVGISGCSADYWAGAYKPTTEFRAKYGPASISFTDSKDNNVSIEGAEYDPVTKKFKIDRLVIINNGSDVVNATGNRALQVAVAMQTQVQYVSALTAGISQIIGATGNAAPGLISAFLNRVPSQQSSGFDLQLPGGGGIGFNNTKTVNPQTAPSP